MNKKMLSLCVVAFVVVGAAFAQDMAGTIAIGVRGGITHYVGDGFASAKQRFAGSVYGENFLSDALSVEAALNFGQLAGETGNQDFQTQLTGLSVLGRMAVLSREGVRPYVAGGAEYFGLDPRGSQNTGFDRSAFAIPVGGGVSFNVAENTALDLRALYHYTFKDRLDGMSNGTDDSLPAVALQISGFRKVAPKQ
jgi:opacity protein-like surface antigen